MSITALLALGGFALVTLLAASSGAVFKPDAWYRAMNKPSWTPPDWVFPTVWTPLYVMIAASGWLVWREAGLAGAALPLAVYVVQLVLNAGWSAVFFGMKKPGLAFVEVLTLWLSIALTMILFWPISKTAALLLAPYLLWVTIASALNFQVWRMNAPDARASAT
ncbi:MAG: sensory protein TspO [Deinococcus-Thermus bacterium]|jgi:tryptophan-rich sensory protein|nr:sensory protein TspO [Deinococcota bacterium]